MRDGKSAYSNPMLMGPSGPTVLPRLGGSNDPEKNRLREDFIQELVHQHPQVIPMVDIEPAFTPLISVCRELETPAGFLDNLWITPEGALVLGECKLVRNPQARREVVVQALDYAQAISKWSVEDLERRAGKARAETGFRLWNLVCDDANLDEVRFHDGVQRRLSAGELMILIIGDGITEGAEALTRYLQLHAGFRVNLALVELSIWRTPDESLLVVPRVPMQTTIVERGVVRIDHNGTLSISAPSSPHIVGDGSAAPQTASEGEFFEQLRSRHPQWVEPLRAFCAELAPIGLTPQFLKSLVLRWSPSPNLKGSAGYVDTYGTLWLGDALGTALKVNNPGAAYRYLEAVARAVKGSVRERQRNFPIVVGPAGRTVHISELLAVADRWLTALRAFVEELNRSLLQLPEGAVPDSSTDASAERADGQIAELSASDFPDRKMLLGMEGGAVYTAEGRGRFYVITDESALVGMLNEDDAAGIATGKVREFESEEDRSGYLFRRGWLPRVRSDE